MFRCSYVGLCLLLLALLAVGCGAGHNQGSGGELKVSGEVETSAVKVKKP